MPLSVWSRTEDLEELVARKGSGFIFKHSTSCPISAAADEEFQRFVAESPEVPVFQVLVIESRPVSNAIAAKLGVVHASPQAILVRDGAAAWKASHWNITAGALASAWAGAAAR